MLMFGMCSDLLNLVLVVLLEGFELKLPFFLESMHTSLASEFLFC